MSRLVSIIEGQSSKQFNNAQFLRTSLQGGGYCDWVLEDEHKLLTKTFTKKGTYYAANEKDSDGQPYYGYSQVTVNVSEDGKVTGKKPDGNEYNVAPDDNGNLVETVLPSSIRITTNPSKMSYNEGEAISLSGAVIKAYKGDGSLWEASGYSGGVIPNSELTLNPATASGGGGGSQGASSDLSTLNNQPIPISNACIANALVAGRYSSVYTLSGNGAGALMYTGSRFVSFLYAASSPITVEALRLHNRLPGYTGYVPENQEISTTLSRTYTHNGKTVYYEKGTFADYPSGSPSGSFVEIVSPQAASYTGGMSANFERDAWTMVYGDITGGGQTIAVNWERPDDNKVLSTSFNISVT